MARISGRGFLTGTLTVLAALLGCASIIAGISLARSDAEPVNLHQPLAVGPAYATLAQKSIFMLEHTFYNGNGLWHMCVPFSRCNTKNMDWGSDSLTYDLYFRWHVTKDPTVVPLLAGLAHTALRWRRGKFGSSDNMMWDAIAEVREYQVTGSKLALAKAKTALATLNAGPSGGGFATGACPAIYYQWRGGHRDGGMKTLETDSNYVKAALLLYQVTDNPAYLRDAEARYAAIRRYYLSPSVPLYTDFVVDNGKTCQAIPRFYLGSANGNMIWAGATLATDTGMASYLRDAIATARAVSAHLSDSAGIYNSMFTDIDLGEPLVEAMYYLATTYHQGFARNWLLTNASAAGGSVNSLNEFGRFFGGPPPTNDVTSWAVNGGVALMTAAAALESDGRTANPGFWQQATWIPRDVKLSGSNLPIHFTGKAIAIFGTIGDVCCRDGHAWVSVDGTPVLNNVGIWQNRSSPARRMYDQVLFAWRWPADGRRTVTIRPATYNVLQGGAYFHMIGYLVVR